MRRKSLVGSVLIAAAVAGGLLVFPWIPQHAQERRSKEVEMPRATSFRILLGLGDTEPTVWDGSVKVASGKILSIQGWRFAESDSSDYQSTWKASTRRAMTLTAAQKLAGTLGPVFENGVIVAAAISDPNSRMDVETRQGSFSFNAQEIPLGESKNFLNGKVAVDRVPSTVQLTTSAEEQDFPAIAQNGDDVYVSYVEFTHGDRSKAVLGIMPKEPASFDFLTRPAGGDQVMLMHYSKSRNIWDAPIAASAPHQDIMRTAIAVDGKKRVWIFWAANQKGNFDLYGRSLSGGEWSSEIRLTSDAGTDLGPVAATDAKGRVWVAWQGFRKNNLEILATVQNGNGFTPETVVSFSSASDWDPSIAAAQNGEVAVSWDTYDKGDYDVYFRRLRADRQIKMDPPVPVAASRNFEARSSMAYDSKNRLWIAYEASDTKWGKDFGAYETTGVALYQGHNIELRCFQGSSVFTTADDLAESLPGAPQAIQRRARRRRGPDEVLGAVPASLRQPNPELAPNRRPSLTPQPPPLPLNSFPRLTADSEGGLYLAFRTVGGAWRSPVGTVWFEDMMHFDGARWNGPIFIPRTDGLLDNRPAFTALSPGHILMVSAMDHRQSQIPGGGRRGGDGINSDLYAAELQFQNSPAPPNLKPLPAESAAQPDPQVKTELDQVAAMRNYRVTLGPEKLQLMRGEFHRHTEISGDGGRDGPLIDAYRYMIDAAYMDWVACCDHDNGAGREYPWWIEQKLTDAYKLGETFVPMFGYERSVRYPEGHRNVVFPTRGIRPLPRLPKMDDDSAPTAAPDTQMLYRYLKKYGGIVASHTSATDMGTDWRDNDPLVEPVVEIYQGDRQNYEMPDAPRSNNAKDSIGGWRPLGFVSLALQKGYKLGFQASSDHISTHMSYCNLWVTAPTRQAIMEAFRKRRIYGATDNILADVRSGGHFMGEEFPTSEPPSISVKLQGTAAFAKVHIVKDGNYVYAVEPGRKNVEFVWKDNTAQKGKTSYYYVRGEQSDGELVWVSPMWITYE